MWRFLVGGQLFSSALALFSVIAISAIGCFSARARAEQTDLPEPLTLSAALAYAEQVAYPEVELAHSELEIAELDAQRIRATYLPSIYLSLVPRQAKRTGSINDDFFNDSFARIHLNQPIYDFGRTESLKTIAGANLASKQKQFELTKYNYRLAVFQKFLDVLLADRRYEIDEEEMTISFLLFDRLREKRELLDEVSEIDVAEAESTYRQALVRRTESQLAQQQSRLLLALALGRTDKLPRDLIRPNLDAWTIRDSPEYDQLVEIALTSNPILKALGDRLTAARENIDTAALSYRPKLYAEIEMTEYATVRAARDDTRASVYLEIPLLNGKQRKINQGIASVELTRIELEITRAETGLREQLFALFKKLNVLALEQAAAESRERFRDLYLDRSRTLYELEVRTDLGDAQAKLLEAGWYAMLAEFNIALTWAQIDVFLGRPIVVSDHSAVTQ